RGRKIDNRSWTERADHLAWAKLAKDLRTGTTWRRASTRHRSRSDRHGLSLRLLEASLGVPIRPKVRLPRHVGEPPKRGLALRRALASGSATGQRRPPPTR